MATQWLRNLGHKASHVKMLRPLYDAQLGKLTEPLVFSSFPADLWGGDAGHGRWIASGQMDLYGKRTALDTDHWMIGGDLQDTPFFHKLHGFCFLPELKALGGDTGRKTARLITRHWLSDFAGYHHIAWEPFFTSWRLVNWLIAYPFCFEQADDDFVADLQDAIYRQFRHMAYTLDHNTDITPFDRFDLLWGLVTLSCHCPQLAEDRFDSWLLLLKGACEDITFDDGGVIDHNPLSTIRFTKQLIILRHSMTQSQIKIPLWLGKHIETSTRFLGIITHGDKGLPVFQESVNQEKGTIEKIMRLANIRIRRNDTTFAQSGYTALRKGKTHIIINHGAGSHISPHAFEMSLGNNRIIVNCGTHFLDPQWQESLQGINAHSTLGINGTEPDSQHMDAIKTQLETMNGACLWSGTHTGYKAAHNLTHTRRIYLDPSGEDCRGEDLLIRSLATKPLQAVIRFHLHPSIKSSVIKDGRAVLMQLPSGRGWIFETGNAHITLEGSIYTGDDGMTVRKTTQIVLETAMDDLSHQIKWAIRAT